MLNAVMLGTQILIHRHPNSNENVLLNCGKLVELICDNDENEVEHIPFDPSVGNFGCIVPAGVWHTVEVLEPSIIYEAKDGRYGDETLDEYRQKKTVASSDIIELFKLLQFSRGL